MSFVPDLVTMFTIPPSARPYSAAKLLFTTRNSLTASCDGVARCDPVAVLMLSAPSTVTLLLRSRCPPNEMRVTEGSVNVDCRLILPVVTPGLSSAKSVNSRPEMGSDWICCVSITWLTSVRVGSMVGASVLTVTSCVVPATFRFTSIVATWATRNTMPVCGVLGKALRFRRQFIISRRHVGQDVKTHAVGCGLISLVRIHIAQCDRGFYHHASCLVAD